MILNCAGAVCTLIEADDIASGAVNTFTADFTFDSDWDGLTKTAVFNNRFRTIAVLLVADSATIPHEVLDTPGDLEIGCVGVTDSTTILTTNVIKVGRIAIGADLDADPSTTPTAGAFEQVISLLAEKVDIVDIVDDLTTGGSAVPLSAEQGKVLQDGLQFEATNIVTNGDFNTVIGWSGIGGALSASFNIGKITGDGTLLNLLMLGDDTLPVNLSSIYFERFRVRINDDVCQSIEVNFDGSTGGTNKLIEILNNPSNGVWYDFAVKDTLPADATGNFRVFIRAAYADAATANDKVMEMQYVSAIDLTTDFGTGNEPTVEEMDAIMSLYENSWFDSTTDIQFVNQIIARLQTKADTVQEDWIEPTLLNGWVNFGSPYFDTGYYKNSINEVNIAATIKDGTITIGTNVFSLAAGYRPANDQYFVCTSNGVFGLVIVRADGDVEIQTANATYLSLDGISFRAEA